MSHLQVIGIAGHVGSGKDTVANLLSALAGFHRVGLADSVRGALSDLDGPTWTFRKDDDESDQSMSGRRSMRLMGTDCREDLGESSLWLNVALAKIRYASHYHSKPRLKFVVPDIRFRHEPHRLLGVVRRWGGRYETWRVDRPGCGPHSDHKSDHGLDQIEPDRVIVNDGSRADLVAKMIAICLCPIVLNV